MLQGEHSAILLTFMKLPIVIKIFVLSIFEWPFNTGFTVVVVVVVALRPKSTAMVVEGRSFLLTTLFPGQVNQYF